MANVLITGGTGFIASHVARQLIASGHKVVCFDNAVSQARLKIIGDKAIIRRGRCNPDRGHNISLSGV